MLEQRLVEAHGARAEPAQLAEAVPVARLEVAPGVDVPRHAPEPAVIEHRRRRHLVLAKLGGAIERPAAVELLDVERMPHEVSAALLQLGDERAHAMRRM